MASGHMGKWEERVKSVTGECPGNGRVHGTEGQNAGRRKGGKREACGQEDLAMLGSPSTVDRPRGNASFLRGTVGWEL